MFPQSIFKKHVYLDGYIKTIVAYIGVLKLHFIYMVIYMYKCKMETESSDTYLLQYTNYSIKDGS